MKIEVGDILKLGNGSYTIVMPYFYYPDRPEHEQYLLKLYDEQSDDFFYQYSPVITVTEHIPTHGSTIEESETILRVMIKINK